MLHTPEAAFIHVPKTGGMSVTRFLINSLDDPVTVFAPRDAEKHTLAMAEGRYAAEKLTTLVGSRHETCDAAVRAIKAAGLSLPSRAFSVVRDPARLLWSYYRHLRKPWRLERLKMKPETLTGATKLAMELPFAEFVEKIGSSRMSDEKLADYYRPHGFDHLDVVALEDLSDYLVYAFGHHRSFDISRLPHNNASSMIEVNESLSAKMIGELRDRYPLTYDTYLAARGRVWRSSGTGA